LKKDTNYTIRLHPQVDRFLNRISKKDKKTLEIILKAIKEIRDNPHGCELIQGSLETRKKRKGNYRILYRINKSTQQPLIEIAKVNHREKVYKKK